MKNINWFGYKGARQERLMRIMKNSLLLIYLGIGTCFANGTYLQSTFFTFEYNNRTVKEIIREIEQSSEYIFFYMDNSVDLNRKVSVKANNERVEKILDQLFTGTPNQYYISDRQIVISKAKKSESPGLAPVQQQQLRTITGVVRDAAGPVIGANVVVKGTTNGSVTDIDGQFTIQNVQSGAVLQVSFIGYVTQEINVTNQTNLEITIFEDVGALEEIIVIGYGTATKKDVTTAVSVVSTKDLDERPITEAVQAIQGKAAGVHVYRPDGSPGAEMVIRVRGTTSITGSNEPLYVVDGVPVDNLSFLSPNDIASMQILKDASSAAIYGSRAANGVVIISTRQADGGAKIRASAQYGFNQISNRIESLNAVQFKELMDEIAPGRIPADATRDLTDWFDEVYTTGFTQNYQVQVSDGNEKLRYFVSGGLTNERGIINSTFAKRYNFRANLENQIRKWLKFGVNLSYADRNLNGTSTGAGSNRGGVILAVVNLPTSVPVKNEEGFYNRSFYGETLTNPLESMDDGKNNHNRNHRLIATGSTTVTFMPGLDLKTMFTMDRNNGLSTRFTPPKHGFDRTEWGEATDNRTQSTVITFENVLNYKKSFANHNVETMLGTSWTDSEYSRLQAQGSHFKDASIQSLRVANQIGLNGVTANANEWAIMSYFGRLSYNFDSKYLFTANIRRDGSSRLHPDYRWGAFPSFSAAWRLSSENFMQGFTWLNDLKLRAGWGQTGNQSGINEYAYLQRYDVSRQEWYREGQENSLVILSPSNIRNSELTWETTTQTNIGLDLTLFSNRLTVTADWYYKYTTDMLMDVSLPQGASFATSIIRNEGEMSNRGWELSVSSRNLTSALQWNTEFVISGNKNKLEYLELQQVYYEAETTDAFHLTRVIRNAPGGPLSRFWGYFYDGVDPQTGDAIYRDLNGDGKITASDKTYIGDPNPDFNFGLTNTFSYKGLNLSIFIQGSYGNDIFNSSTGDLVGMYDCRNQSVDVLRRWRKPGDITDIPKSGWNVQPSTFFVEDGSYIRLKDVSLSYNFRSPLLRKLGITRLQPYVTGRNLLTLTSYNGMDPEVNQYGNRGAIQGIDWGTYPHSKVYVIGVNVEF
ncbi:MAG: TonB-dependent receptor [Tannerellaceae bacterium]|jgi:TonB-linked SusC/RagA family outer membrane protein|nr:TonB-dependent receptor [Tannerellaceae bacterium]